MVDGAGISMSWLTLTALLVLSSCSCWMLAGGQTCSLSGSSYVMQEITVYNNLSRNASIVICRNRMHSEGQSIAGVDYQLVLTCLAMFEQDD